jgi:hypothetical protein
MAQYQQQMTASAPALAPQGRSDRLGRQAALIIGILMLIAAVAATTFAFSAFTGGAAAPATSGDVVDGWALSGATRQAALDEANQIVDGWYPALSEATRQRALDNANQLVDGWALSSANGD